MRRSTPDGAGAEPTAPMRHDLEDTLPQSAICYITMEPIKHPVALFYLDRQGNLKLDCFVEDTPQLHLVTNTRCRQHLITQKVRSPVFDGLFHHLVSMAPAVDQHVPIEDILLAHLRSPDGT